MEPIKITTWIIMDKKRKLIGMGNPRDRRLQFVNQEDGSGRMLTYKSKKRAEAGFKVSGFWTWDCKDYIEENYGFEYVHNNEWQLFLEAVEIDIIIKEK